MFPRVPTALGLTRALDRLGFRTSVLPSPSDIAPVMVVADISRTVASEVVEARRIATIRMNSTAGEYAGAQLTCEAPGGLVLEYLFFGVEDFVVGAFPSVTMIKGNTGVSAAIVSTLLDIGGVACRSPFAGFSQAALPVDTQVCRLQLPNRDTYSGGTIRCWGELPTRIYLHPSERLAVFAPQNLDVDILFVWRELGDIQGSQQGV